MLTEEVALLQKSGSTSEDLLGLPTDDGDSSLFNSNGSRKRSSTSAHDSHRAKCSLKPRDPKPYKGGNLKEHREFIRSCEMAFELTLENFSTERQRVMWAMQYLEGDPREAWWTHWERMSNTDNMIWKEFKDFLLDQVSDPINCTLEAATKHSHAL